MTIPGPQKVGWCPGALRPMATGDGLVVRVKPSGGVLELDRADALAGLAQQFGNGDLDLTARSNLQIRGVRNETLAPLLEGLACLGLLDPDPDAEAVRNIVVSPLAGLDPAARFDVRPLVAALEDRFVVDRTLHRLPAKWSIVVDDGGLSLSGVAADLRFEADSDGTFLVGLGADPARAFCSLDQMVAAAVALSRLALTPGPRRMDALVRDMGAAAVFAAVGLSVAPAVGPSSNVFPSLRAEGEATQSLQRPGLLRRCAPRNDVRRSGSPRIGIRQSTRPRDVVGLRSIGNTIYMGVAAAFGSLKARDLGRLIQAARHAGAGDVRLTPWRVLLVVGVTNGRADAFGKALAGTDLILQGQDPRLSVAACSGAPACHRGTTPVRDHARLLAALPRSASSEPIALHVSGCGKGCAHGHAAPWTLVGRDGLYDIVHNGKAGDAPVAHALSFQDAALWLSRFDERRA